MKQIEFRVPPQCDLKGAEVVIERVFAVPDLYVGIKGSLAGFPGCIHWHLKKPAAKGTLEITLYPKERRLWAQVQDKRKAPWIERELPLLRAAIEAELSGRSAKSCNTQMTD